MDTRLNSVRRQDPTSQVKVERIVKGTKNCRDVFAPDDLSISWFDFVCTKEKYQDYRCISNGGLDLHLVIYSCSAWPDQLLFFFLFNEMPVFVNLTKIYATPLSHLFLPN